MFLGKKHCYLTRSVIMIVSISLVISRKKFEERYEFILEEEYSIPGDSKNNSENQQSIYHLSLKQDTKMEQDWDRLGNMKIYRKALSIKW